MKKCYRTISSFVLASIVLIQSGCQDEKPLPAFPHVTVEGRLVRGAQPVSSGWVEFVPVEGGQGVLRSSPLLADGSFRITYLGPGLHNVRVIVPRDRTFFPFDQFFSPIRRTLSSEPVQKVMIDLNTEPKSIR